MLDGSPHDDSYGRGRTVAALRATLAVACALAAGSCVLSVDAFVPPSDAIFDPRLVGTWVADKDTATVTRDSGNAYAIRYVSDGKVGRLQARLGRVGERAVFDVSPAAAGDDNMPLATALMIPGHLLYLLHITPDSVVADALDADSLYAALRSRRVRLVYSADDDALFLHGTTRQLRDALGPYLARAPLSRDPAVWRRLRVDSAAAADAVRGRPPEVPCFEAASWREADRLFHRDPHWLGADVASSVDLGGGRTLWLFGDTWIDTSGAGRRHGARMVANTVAIQRGADPSTADITFYWGRAAGGGPGPFFADRGDTVLWPGHGVRLGDRLLLFVMPTIRGGGALGFRSAGWGALLVENPDEEPSAWRIRTLDTPPNPLGIVLGGAEVLRLGNDVIALGGQDPVKSHPIFAARWTVEAARRGDLSRPAWWAGPPWGWVADSSRTPRWPLFENGQSELSVIADSVTHEFLAVQTVGFGPADVAMRAASGLTGPWTAPRTIYHPPEYDRPNVMIYAAKAHPQLAGADLVLTYATNSFRFADQADTLIYYPRFVRLMRCAR